MLEHVGNGPFVLGLEPLVGNATACVMKGEHPEREDQPERAGFDQILFSPDSDSDVPVFVADGRLELGVENLEVEKRGVLDELELDARFAAHWRIFSSVSPSFRFASRR